MKIRQLFKRKPKKKLENSFRIGVVSAKGGVGKSTIAYWLANTLAQKEYQVGLFDADIYGPSQALLLGDSHCEVTMTKKGQIVPAEHDGIHYLSASLLVEKDSPLVWRAPMANQLIKQMLNQTRWPELDVLLFDLPPGTGDIHITLAQLAALDAVVLVSTNEHLAQTISKRSVELYQKVNIPIVGIIENFHHITCPHCHKDFDLNEQSHEQLADIIGQIPHSQQTKFSQLNDKMKASLDAVSSTIIEKMATMKAQIPHYSSTDTHLSLQWEDGSKKQINAYDLRCACQCALCIDEKTGQSKISSNTIDENLHIASLNKTGSYGLNISFSDGHNTGIYRFDTLRNLSC
jgi:ATP-binding protein involved in chromosome partitioning